MELIGKTQIDFIGMRRFCYLFSSLLVLGSLCSIVFWKGLNLGIDFAGGNLLQIHFEREVSTAALRQALVGEKFSDAQIQNIVGVNDFIVRIKGSGEEGAAARLLEGLGRAFPANRIELKRREYVGPAVGSHLVRQAWWAILFSLGGIVCYVAFRFRNFLWGGAGVLALAHDVWVALGFLSITQKEVNLVTVAALLTLAGYSINDTIVIFDRMREKARQSRRELLGDLINASLNETLSRTLMTTLTTLLAVAALMVWGGEVIHDFALVLCIGMFLGTYSTLGIAVSILYDFQAKRGR
ncbi:MAG: protein translocase subunit SecF [Elusimicrobia bacterium]|nr:protein translocase subunit SecF [Elusimicrobiota bacterium]